MGQHLKIRRFPMKILEISYLAPLSHCFQQQAELHSGGLLHTLPPQAAQLLHCLSHSFIICRTLQAFALQLFLQGRDCHP